MALSKHDGAVLNAIFQPLLPASEFNDDVGDSPTTIDDDYETINDESFQESRKLEKDAVNLAEDKKIEESLQFLNKSIEICPRNASAYNNRAQVHRLNNDMDAALNDLNEAIKLSQGRGPVARQAFCQRGLVYQIQGQKKLAIDDFQAASKLGSGFAKSALVHLNPYAALCSEVLGEIFQKLNH